MALPASSWWRTKICPTNASNRGGGVWFLYSERLREGERDRTPATEVEEDRGKE